MVKLETLKLLFSDLERTEKIAFEGWVKNEVNKLLIHSPKIGDGYWSTNYNE